MKIFNYIVLVLLLFPACQRQECTVTPVPELVTHTLYAFTPGEDEPQTRTIVSAGDEKKILWSAHESISVLSGSGNYPFVGDNEVAASSASFTGTGPASLDSYIALYPYNASASYDGNYVSTSLPAIQTGKGGTFADGYLITADDATGNSISFNHVCSGLRFMVNRDDITAVTIRGNNGEKIAGAFRFRFASENTPVAEAGTEECVTLNAPDGHFETGTLYYIVILPTVFSKGFTIMADNGSKVGAYSVNSAVTFTAGKFKNITGNLDARMTDSWITPSSQVYYGPENSFSIRPGEILCFDVSPRKVYGTWQRSGLPASADVPNDAAVLWGNGSISSASVVDGKLTVTASSTPGSALVAIKKNETILWSYLIWVTASEPVSIELPSKAKLQEPLGGQLYFQWGRKDPLKTDAARVENKGSAGLAYSISQPTEYIKRGTSQYDWITDDQGGIDWTLWGEGAAKTIWDPCPAGYRVPTTGDYSEITDLSSKFEALGYIADDGYHNYNQTEYCYWTRSTGFMGDVRKLSWSLDGSKEGFLYTDFRHLAYPIRCVKE